MRRNHHILRTLVCGSLTALVVASAGSVAQGQAGITVTFPARVVAAPDYATEVLGDAWDMCNPEDISPFPQELVGFSSFTFSTSPCRAGGPVNAADSSVVFLHRGIYGIVNPGRNGRNFPIDPSRYQILSYKLNSNVAGQTPQLYWFHNPHAHPSGDAFGVRYSPTPTVNGTQIVAANLGGAPDQGVAWSSGSVAGLRIDPNNTNAGQNVSFRWVRLTPASGAVQRITWSGGTGNATITVTDNSDGTVVGVASGISSNFYDWNYGYLAPGGYALTVTKPGSSGSTAFSINQPPAIQVTDPSLTSGEDFATTVRGNPWDMSDAGDLIVTGTEHTTAPVSFSGGQASATNSTNDPNVTLNRTVPIDTTKYRYLTYRFQVDGAFDLGPVGGSVARVLWGPQGSLGTSNTTTSKDILVWPGMNSYTVDLASLSTDPDGGLVDSAGGLWTASPKLSLRFDPHEGSAQRAFHIDDVRLTAKPVAAGSFTIRFAGSDANGDAATVSLYIDNDTNAANGKTQIASGIPMSVGQFAWNTSGLPQGEYYIYAEANDGIQANGRYSSAPVQVSATTALAARPGDFDGDRRTDLTVFRPSNGQWLTKKSSSGYTTWDIHPWGLSSDVPVPGDYDGDGKTDIAVYRPSNGNWYLLLSSTNFTAWTVPQWGLSGDVPMPGDYDGDGRTDPAVYRPSNGSWYLLLSSTNYASWSIIQWGSTGDVPMPGDYDGDRKTDPAVYRPSNGNWLIKKSSSGYTTWDIYQWGLDGDVPMPGDYDGDRKTDVAVYRPSNGNWIVLKSSTNSTGWTIRQWGLSGDEPTPGDYDGDGKTDFAVYRPSNGTWYLLQSSTNFTSWTIVQWGTNGDRPVVQK